MTTFIALLRAINVGGTGKLAMAELRALCEAAGLENVGTYIQSGNVVFSSRRSEAEVRTTLERALAEKLGKPVGVHLRTRDALAAVADRNPFPDAAPSQVLVLFLDGVAPADAIANVAIPAREELVASGREIFIHFPDGMGRSKLKIPFASTSTGRNLNTVRKLVELAQSITAG